MQAGSGYTVGAAASASVDVSDNDDPPVDPDPPSTDEPTEAQLVALATALRDKYATL